MNNDIKILLKRSKISVKQTKKLEQEIFNNGHFDEQASEYIVRFFEDTRDVLKERRKLLKQNKSKKRSIDSPKGKKSK